MKTLSLLFLSAALFEATLAVSAPDFKINCKYGVVKRKEYGTLSSDEKTQYISALKRVQIRPAANQPSFYDSLVKQHMDHAPEVHGTPRFLPWHRMYLAHLEAELQNVSGQPIAIPFWDWTKDSQAPEMGAVWGTDAVSFGQSGDNRGCVNSGAFAGYQVLYPSPRCLQRQWNGGNKMSALTSTDVFEKVLTDAKTFDACRTAIEGPHGSVHVAIGGDMGVMNSPNDMIFYLHHANVDRLWNRWQVLHPDLANTYNGWNAKPTDVLSPYKYIVSDAYDTTKLCFQYRHFGKDGKSDSGEVLPPVVRAPPPADPTVLKCVQSINNSSGGSSSSIPDAFDRTDLFKLRAPTPLPDEWIRMNNMDPSTVRQCEQKVVQTVQSCNEDLTQLSSSVLWNNDLLLQRLVLLHAQLGEDFDIKVGGQTVSVHVDASQGDQWLNVFKDQIKQILLMVASGQAK